METEQQLLNGLKQMKKDALVKIFDLYATPLYNYALRLCRDPLLADHIVGDVFAKLLDQLAAGKGPTLYLRSYLYETAYHLVVDEARASGRRVSLDALAALKPDVRSARLSVEDQLMYERALDAVEHDLTNDQRHVIILRFLEEFSLRETAAILGKDINHIKVIQTRALAKLRQIFERNELRVAVSAPRVEKYPRALST